MRYSDLDPYAWVYIIGRPSLDSPPFYSSGRSVRLADMESASGLKPRVFGMLDLNTGLFDIVENNDKF